MSMVPVMLIVAVVAAPQAFRNATVVSTDAPHLTLTIKGDQGASEVLPVDAAALARLRQLKPGDEVILTLRTDGARQVVTLIEPSVRGRKPAGRTKPRAARASPSPSAPDPSPTTPAPSGTTPRVSPAPASPRPPTDTVGPLQDPRRGAQQDPRDNPGRDPRVVPGLTVPPSNPPATSSPSPSPTPTPAP